MNQKGREEKKITLKELDKCAEEWLKLNESKFYGQSIIEFEREMAIETFLIYVGWKVNYPEYFKKNKKVKQ